MQMTYGRWRGATFIPDDPPRPETWNWALPRLQGMPPGYYRIGPGDDIRRIE